MATFSQVLADILTLTQDEQATLVQTLIRMSGCKQVSAPIAQTAPQSTPAQVSAPKAQAPAREVNDTVVAVALSHDGKGVEFTTEDGKSAFVFMGAVREQICAEDNELKLIWDRQLESTDTYHDDRNGHVYGAHKLGAYRLVRNDKPFSKAKVAEWVAAHPMFVLTAEEKLAHKEAKADKDAKKIERAKKLLASKGLI